MEFKFPAMNDRQPLPQPAQSPSFPAVPTIGDAWERSREEIILDKIARCREIELEARREILLLEREMADRRADLSVFHSRYEHMSPQPQDFPVELDAKDKLIVLVKPNPNISGTKRKTVEPPSLPGSTTTKLKDDWLCAICEVNAPSEKLWNQHLQGKKHIAMEELIRNEKVSKKPIKEEDEIGGDLKSVAQEHGKRAFKFWCELCKIGAFRSPVMEDHKKGKKHKRRLAKQETRDQDASETTCVSQEVNTIRQKQQDFHGGETCSKTTVTTQSNINFPKLENQELEF